MAEVKFAAKLQNETVDLVLDRIEPVIVDIDDKLVQANEDAGRSEDAASRSELAATQAAVAQPAYDTIAAGLAATPNGGVFNVRGAGDTFATSYRNDNGVASAALGSFPSKAYLDGIAPAVNSKVMVLAKAPGVDVASPTKDNSAAIQAAIDEARVAGKTIDLGNDTFRVGSGWSTYALTSALHLRGDGAVIQNISPGNKNFMSLRAPIQMEGLHFENFSALLSCDTNGIDLSDHDIILRNIDHLNCNQGLIFNTLENFRIRDLILEMINIDSVPFPSGVGKGQGIRWQANGFRRAYLRNIFCRNRNFQGIRIGGYPHDLVLNQHIHMESLHVDGVISNGQSNGIQAFGSDVYANDIYVTRIDCTGGTSSNVEPFYTAGDSVDIGNITVDTAGNGQGAIAIKSSRTRQHGPLRIRTRLHPRMNCAMRIDGFDVELTGGIDIRWSWESLAASVPDVGGDNTYAVDYRRLDTAITDALDYYFVPHAINTSSTPTLKVGPFAAKPMVRLTDGLPIEPGYIRPGFVYRATYNAGADNFRVFAVNWDANCPIVSGSGNNITVPGTLVDGATYWAIPMQTLLVGATFTVGASPPVPIKMLTSTGLIDIPNNDTITNGFPKGYYYSAADNAMVLLHLSGKPYAGIGRFVPEVSGITDMYTFSHPYPEDYADALFCIFPANNVGAVTLNGEQVLNSSGAALSAGYIVADLIYQLLRSGNTWRATRVSDSNVGVDSANAGSGRSIIRDVTFENAHYTVGIDSISTGHSEVSNIKVLGRSRIKSSVASVALSQALPINGRAYVSDIKVRCFYKDMPDAVVSVGPGFTRVDVSDIPAPQIRGQITGTRGTVIKGVTTPNLIGFLRSRSVEKAPSQGNLIQFSNSFTTIDSDHTSVSTAQNPPAVGGTGTPYVELAPTYTHIGAEPGDIVTATHEMNNTRLQFGGYVTSRDTLKVFVRDPNPAGAPIDLASGRLYFTTRRVRDS